MKTMRRRTLFAALSILLPMMLAACAGLSGREPVNVYVVGVEPLPGQGMEARFAVKLRVQNPNDQPVEFNGVFVELDVRGSTLASGVSDQAGTVPRFGETVVTVPVTVPATAMIRQVLGLATAAPGDRTKVDYTLRGKLAGPMFNSVSFDSKGELQLPGNASGAAR